MALQKMAQTTEKPFTALIGPCLSVTLAALGISIAAVTLPTVTQELADTRVDVTLVVSMYILATTALIVPIGRAGDLFGKRNILVAGITVFFIGALLAGTTLSLPMLIAARFLQGAGAAAMLAMPMALIRDVVAPDRVGRWMGGIGTMQAIGTASGPTLGGAITASLGWQAVYLLLVPFAATAILLTLLFRTEEHHHDAPPKFDIAGALALATSLAFLTFFITGAGMGATLSNVLLLALTGLSFTGFLWIETSAAAPIIPLSALRSRHLSAHLAMNAGVSMVMMGILVVGPFFLTGGLGLTTVQMGAALSVGPISAALSGIPAGRVTEKLGPQHTVILGSGMVTLGAVLVSALPYLFGLTGFIVAFLVLAPGYQLFLASVNTAVMSQATETVRGMTSGLLNLSRSLGFVIGAALMSAVFWALVDAQDPSRQDALGFANAMAGTFAVASMLGVGVLLLAVLMKSSR